jgi:sigma-B regulation protein RsbU (phosphoserine phosphatase)
MSAESDLIEKLTTLNHIAETLNQAVDVQGVLNHALAELIELMGLETGWIFLKDPAAADRGGGSGYVLAAHHNLPPAMETDKAEAWEEGCVCQGLCNSGGLSKAYNEVRCSRLAGVSGDRRGLAMHASTPLCSGDRVLGILNVAAPDWASFKPEALALLTNVGNQIGVALERARLFDLLQERRLHEQATLLDFSSQLLGRSDLGDLMHYLVEEVRQMLRADACALLLPGEEPGFLDFRAASGWQVDPVAERQRVSAAEDKAVAVVMHTQRPFVVEDVEKSELASWMPDWLREEGFQGHAVVPLIADGRSIGILVLNTRQPRRADEGELRLLRLMANQAAIAVEKARLHQEEVKGQGMEKELAIGRQIQLSLLPEYCPAVAGWEFAAFYQAARQVGGDFYDFFELPGQPGRLGLLIADVMGKGVPAALFMAVSRTVIRTTALDGHSPAATLMQANELILEDSHSELFLTAFYGVLDTRSGRMVYANAGHNRPLWLQAATGKFEELAARGIVLGAMQGIELEECEIEVAPGDLLVFYTDGVTEAMDARHEVFDVERLRASVATTSHASTQQILGAVVDAVHAYTGDVPQSDDMALVAVKRT